MHAVATATFGAVELLVRTLQPQFAGAANPLEREGAADAHSDLQLLGGGNGHAHGFDPRDLSAIRPVAGAADLRTAREAVRQVLVADEVLGYIVDIVGATRNSPSLQLGVSPRGATALLGTARAWAWLSGRSYVTPDDVKAMARPTLRHRVALRPEAELEGASPDGVLDGILSAVPVPR